MTEVKKPRGKPSGRPRKYELPNESKAVPQLQDKIYKLKAKLEQAQLRHRLDIAARILPEHIHLGGLDDAEVSCQVALTDAEIKELKIHRDELLEVLEAALPLLHTGDEIPMEDYRDRSCVLGRALTVIAKVKGKDE